MVIRPVPARSGSGHNRAMSVQDHRAAAPPLVVCAVLTVSDTRTMDTDTSGRAIGDLLAAAGHEVADRRIVKDDPGQVVAAIRAFVQDRRVQAVITTGGTGITSRDNTFEALSAIFDKELRGFGELFRMLSYREIGAAAMLTRATAGVCDGRIVFVLPGSEHAVRLGVTTLILPELGHVVRELAR
jgi:molybdopterin adenylyltransferase